MEQSGNQTKTSIDGLLLDREYPRRQAPDLGSFLCQSAAISHYYSTTPELRLKV